VTPATLLRRADKPLPLGTTVPLWGEVAAVLLTGGERYYHMVGKGGVVSMMPATIIEAAAKRRSVR
jgi:hypothetical protein